MKSTTLKASLKVANEIKANLLQRQVPSKKVAGKMINIFKERQLLFGGFEIYVMERNPDGGDAIENVVFRYTQDPAPRIDYNENIITID